VECYVDSSPQALKLCQKFGWVKKAERERCRESGTFDIRNIS
jgi:hypothetical protein